MRWTIPRKTPLLWVLRDDLGFTSVKYGCGAGECGSCTVLIEGKAERSCTIPAEEAVGKEITTIEGLPADHPIKQTWIAEQVPQCGYCPAGNDAAGGFGHQPESRGHPAGAG